VDISNEVFSGLIETRGWLSSSDIYDIDSCTQYKCSHLLKNTYNSFMNS